MDKEEIPTVTEIAKMRVGDIITRWPEAVDALVENGLPQLGDPDHQEKVKGFPVTLEMASGRHGLDATEVASHIRDAITKGSAKK